MRTRVKICGITRVEDALAAAQAGTDAIGLVFYAPSPRSVTIGQAREICEKISPFISVIALFVNAKYQEVKDVLDHVPVDMLQFHGSEQADDCECFARPYIKAIGMQPGVDPVPLMRAHPRAHGFLLDAYQPDTHGGGGLVFDWSQVPEIAEQPLILAGGLTPGNVEDAIRRTSPYAVDVSSGVESGKGIKSAEKIHNFIRGVQRGDASQAGG